MHELATTAIPQTLPTFNLLRKGHVGEINPPAPPKNTALSTLPGQTSNIATGPAHFNRANSVLSHIQTAAVPAAKQLNLLPDSVPLEIWEGTVQEVDFARETMQVNLEAKSGSIPPHSGQIGLQWVTDQDKDLVRPGAVFYLTLYKQTLRGSVQNVQDLRFRRRPGWSKIQLDQIKTQAALLASKIRSSG